jgi:cytochrome c biogenesis protein CcdA
MTFALSLPQLALAVAAGGLTTLSPCVFPLLPLVLGGALQGHRLAPVAMAPSPRDTRPTGRSWASRARRRTAAGSSARPSTTQTTAPAAAAATGAARHITKRLARG